MLTDPTALIRHITERLQARSRNRPIFPVGVSRAETSAAVLCLLGFYRSAARDEALPCFVFNKRSPKVRQAGDFCFPGGRMMPRLDAYLAWGLKLPFSPLHQWPYWKWWRKHRPLEARRLLLLLSAALREGLEEMRLNPLGVRFLGPLPAQSLQMFRREIYPMVAWIGRQRHFFPNWEVEKIVRVPIRNFLDPAYYARCRIRFGSGLHAQSSRDVEIFPCFRLPDAAQQEVLWGATYRMVMNFLDLVFDFRPPPMEALAVVDKRLEADYVNRGNAIS